MRRYSFLPVLAAAQRRRFAGLLVALWVALLLSATAHPLFAQEGITVVYVVQPGETLSSIAAQYGVDAETLIAVNNLEDANAIFVGQKLRVPVTALDPSQPAPAGTYRVQPGETLSTIAARFGISVEDLMRLNDIANADAVFSGQLLRVDRPAVAAATPTPVPTDAATPETSTDMLTPLPTEAAAAPAEATAPLPEFHTVQPGETLTGIARSYGIPAATLKALNNLTDADFIVVGQTIRLSVQAPDPADLSATVEATLPATLAPTAEPTAATAAPATPAPAEPTATAPAPTAMPAPTATPPGSYTVQTGDTLTAIARRFGVPAETIKALNSIEDENAIYVGQELLLSAPTPTPAPTATNTPAATATPVATPTTPATEATSTEATSTDTGAVATEQAAAAAPLPPAPIVRSGVPSASLNQTVTVRFGDTLTRIALRSGVDADALRRLNNFDSVNAPLNSGQTLLLPATADELNPPNPAQEHVVQPGESVGAIATAYGLTNGELLAANQIEDANAIFPGQRLLIPSPAVGGDDPGNQIGPASSGFFYYTVQPGDTLSQIARQFGSTMEALREYNGLPDNETVYTGLELKIPYGAPELPVDLPPVPMSGTRFVVSLSRQQCWVFQGDQVRYAWNCSTGIADRKTKPGNYHVQTKIANAKSKVWRLDMPYWLGIYDVGDVENGIHGLPMAWRTGKKIWEGLIGQPATFGCAMLDDANAATLYNLAFLGMPVHIVN